MKKATLSIPLALLIVASMCLAGAASTAQAAGIVADEVRETIQRDGSARVIVRLKPRSSLSDESSLSDVLVQRQRAEIGRLQRDVITRVKSPGSRLNRSFKSMPYIAMELDAEGLAELTSPGSEVERIVPDRTLKPLLIESTYQIEADIAHAAGMTGTGTTIVVIDTGAEKSHPFLAGRVVQEACFATNDSGRKGACPNRQTSQVGNGAGEPCTFDSLSCYHGTHVSGIALGSNDTMTGVAPGATLIPIQVFHQVGTCGFLTPCAEASESDVVAALEWVYDIRNQYPVVAVNMSLGGGLHSSTCDAEYPLMSDAINNLKSVGIATIAASGNDGDPGAIATPACISSSISVGAVDEQDNVAYFSNGAVQVDLLAPGTTIDSSDVGGGYRIADGTSMATPHVAGAWAIMRQAYGEQAIDAELDFLKTNGQIVVDNRTGNAVNLSRIRLGPAAGIVNPPPVLLSLSPTTINAGRQANITVSGAGFVRTSVVLAGGVKIPTTFVNESELQAVVPKSMLGPTANSISVAVETPPLGGGTSTALSIAVTQPKIMLDRTSVDPGATVTATMTDSPGNQYDWMVLVPVGAPSSSWVKMTFVPPYETGMDWNVAMPTTAGEYEIRLLEDGTYNLLAKSETITVGNVTEPPPGTGGDPSVALSATNVEPGATVTATMTDGPGNQYDWMVLVPVGAPSSSWLKMVFVTPYQTGMVWNVAMPTTAGEYEIRLLEDGAYNVLATSQTITVGEVVDPPPGTGGDPAVALSATTVDPGATVTATMTDGPGNQYDWMILVPVGAPSSSWLKMVFVPPYQTSMDWNVAMPTTAGEYEIRLLEDGAYSVLATSETITVGEVVDPPPGTGGDPSITLGATAVGLGATVTAMMTDGPGNQYDWMVLVPVGAPSSSWSKMVFVPPYQTSMEWNVAMPTTAGEYEIRLLEDGTYNVLATSETITVGNITEPPPGTGGDPGIAVSATTAGLGATVTAMMTNSPGNQYDWMVLVPVGSSSRNWLKMTFVTQYQTWMNWNVSMPATPGEYEIRLLKDGSYKVLATSPTITVTQ